MLEIGKITKYYNNGYGFIEPMTTNFPLKNKEVFFHITTVEKFENDLIKFSDKKIKDLYFWFISKDGIKGKEVVEFWSDISSIPKEYSNLIPLNIAKYLFNQYSLTVIKSEELANLLIEVSKKKFKLSSDLSKYITNKNLGSKYPNIAGIVTMSNNLNEWNFNGGFPKDIYRIICRELNLKNKCTSARAIQFVSYKELKNN